MSGTPASLVCFGLIGTVACDEGMVERAYAEACATQGIVPGTAAYARSMVHVHNSRGQSPVDVFRGLFPDSPGRAEAAALSFDRACRTTLERSGLSAQPGAHDVIAGLRDSGIRVCVVTSLSRRLLGLALDTLGWWRQFDLALCHEDVPRGCPWPDLMLTAMLRLGVRDVREAVFAGSTESGVRCGNRAGAGLVAGVLTGTHTEQRLRGAGATHILGDVTELPRTLAARPPNMPLPAPPPPGGHTTGSAPSPRVALER